MLVFTKAGWDRDCDFDFLVELVQNRYQPVNGEADELCIANTGELARSHPGQLLGFANGEFPLISHADNLRG